jgi:hypothetical protein
MKKLAIALLATAALSASAFDTEGLKVNLSHGQDKTVKASLNTLTVGKEFYGVDVSGVVARAAEAYTSYGLQLSKTVPVGPVAFAPHAGFSAVNMDGTYNTAGIRDANVYTAGLTFAVPVAKNVALTADWTHRVNQHSDGQLQGKTVTFGVNIGL